jgi:putative ABC transport system permease protein
MISLVVRNLRFFWRSHLWVVLGVATSAAVLVGALLVGDSVRLSLRDQALRRIGAVDSVLQVHERFFAADLADRLADRAGIHGVAPVLALSGIAKNRGISGSGRGRQSAGARSGIVEVLGIDERFFQLAPNPALRPPLKPGQAYLNAGLARQLNVEKGGRILLRVEKPGLLPREMAMASVEDASFALGIEVLGVLADSDFGRFGLRAGQVPPFNLFVSLDWLQEQLELGSKANLLLVDGSADSATTTRDLNTQLQKRWGLQDLETQIRPVGAGDVTELLSDRVFLDPALVATAARSGHEFLGVLTYFVEAIRKGERSTPYSMVTAVGRVGSATQAESKSLVAGVLRDLLPGAAAVAQNGIVLNEWCAEDLAAKVGDSVHLDYQVLGPRLELLRRSREFRVAAIVKLAGSAADPTLMPAFPGLHDSENCRDWETGFPIDLERIRDKDEDYWDQYRGTPKAFVGLSAGQDMWQNRYGALTGLRASKDSFAQLAARTDPAQTGFYFRDVRTEALASGTSATDFGGLFLGLSFFLILAALMLTSLLFVFGVDRRSREIGMLLTLGFRPAQVRKLFLLEALVLATLGSLLGAGLGLGYTTAVLHGLDTLWQGAVGSASLTFHVVPTTLVMGAVIALVVAMAAIAFALRQTFGLAAVELLASRNGIPREQTVRRAGWLSNVLMFGTPLLAVGLAIFAGSSAEQVVGAFFGAGALLLIGALAACRRLLLRLSGVDATATGSTLPSIAGLSLRNAGRRPGRSLLTVAMLACGTFLVVAVQANRLETPRDATRRDSGTGGFAWFGRSALPVLRDLNTAEGRQAFGLSDQDLQGVGIVPMRVRKGDDASCLNLSQAQLPTLLGVDPTALAQRGAFRFAGVLDADPKSPWNLLAKDYGPGVVPAIGDAASVTWALHKALGDDLSYQDERGQDFAIRIVGTVAGSILQGSLLVSDQHLRSRYPSLSGHSMFLIDGPPARSAAVAGILSRALEDIGFEVTSTSDRLAGFQEVQNTYLLIFQVLGGLGLLLGSLGVGVVVLRNALERRAELGLLSAVGYSRGAVRRLVFTEHGALLGLGMGSGVLAALLAVMPGAGPVSWAPMVALLVLVAGSGLLWVALATRFATRGELLAALQDD